VQLGRQVEEWFRGSGRRLSRYFLSRFNGGLGILDSEDPPAHSLSVCPDGLADLTAAEACAVVAAVTVVLQDC
jgi:hypothetical protein